jgi:hypothetical protein
MEPMSVRRVVWGPSILSVSSQNIPELVRDWVAPPSLMGSNQQIIQWVAMDY